MKLQIDMDIIIIKPMIGSIFSDVNINNQNDELKFIRHDGSGIKFLHYQDCCESVVIDDIEGDLNDLLGYKILVAEEVSHYSKEEDCGTWTFYKFATVKGFVTVKWLGTSNGYYSESVSWETF